MIGTGANRWPTPEIVPKKKFPVPQMCKSPLSYVLNPYPYGPIANLFPMGGGRHVSPSYDVF